jgi:hypothetical protein
VLRVALGTAGCDCNPGVVLPGSVCMPVSTAGSLVEQLNLQQGSSDNYCLDSGPERCGQLGIGKP